MNTFKKGQLIQFSEDEKLVFGKIEQVLDNDSYIVSYLTLFKGRRVTILEKKSSYDISIVKNEYNTRNVDELCVISDLKKDTQFDFVSAYENEKENSLRDMVAMHALQGLVSKEKSSYTSINSLVENSFEYADEFLKQRKQKGSKDE